MDSIHAPTRRRLRGGAGSHSTPFRSRVRGRQPASERTGDLSMNHEPATTTTVSIVLPAYNEAEILETTVDTLRKELASRPYEAELLIVENGSTDDTVAIGEALAASHDNVSFQSLNVADYGEALCAGLRSAKNEFVVNFDVDFYDIDFLDQAVARLAQEDGLAVVVGSKRGEGAADTRFIGRRLVTEVFSTILRYGFGLSLSDTHGIKAMRRAPIAALSHDCQLRQDLFDTELIIRAERAGLGTAEIPVKVVEIRPARSTIIKRMGRSILGLVKLRVALWRK